ncbi:hypothetical protein VPH47_15150 [Stenotrophomonas sp. WED208]|uniref:hypothetical protein n=1 Tax=Stenotrophomonas sp. WED208 TaxID=3112800 RepID=UPI0034D57F5E
MTQSIFSCLHPLLAEIAAKRSARLPGEGVKYLLEYDRELLIDVLLREFAKAGLGTGDEPNQRDRGDH